MPAKRNVVPIKKNHYHDKHSFILLNAGIGHRTKSFGNRCLFKTVNNESILDRQIRIIKQNFDNPEIVLITGFEADKVMNKAPHDIIQVENERFEDLGIARSISLGLRACTTNNVFLIYGDLIFSDNIFNYHAGHSYVILDRSNLMSSSQVGCNVHEHSLELMMFDLSNKWAQIAFFTGKELKLLQQAAWKKENHKMFGFELINDVINRNGNMLCVENKDIKVFDVDSPKDLEKVNKI